MEEKNSKLQTTYKIIMLVILTAFITFLATSIGIYNYITNGEGGKTLFLSSSLEDHSNLSKALKGIKAIVDKYYLGEQNEQKQIEGAIKGYVNAIGDEYTEYITAEEMEEYKEQILGNYVGIGIYMIANTEYDLIQVLSPIKESPAYEAGILPGDLILSVDGVEYKSTDMTVAANKIKGEEGSKVKLVILRDEKEIEFELTRRTVNTNPIEAEILENHTGYLAIASFDEGTAREFKAKYQELKSKGIKSLIIDLRNNGGGLVQEALTIADYIVEKGQNLLITVDKENREEITKAEKSPIITMPIIVLTNENTASASEILAGALKDNNKAEIVGTKTFGKGVIQQIMTLNGGAGIKITVEEYFTPNKSKINKIGIEPNEIVELPKDVENYLIIEREKDTQLNRAIEKLKDK